MESGPGLATLIRRDTVGTAPTRASRHCRAAALPAHAASQRFRSRLIRGIHDPTETRSAADCRGEPTGKRLEVKNFHAYLGGPEIAVAVPEQPPLSSRWARVLGAGNDEDRIGR